MDLNDAERYAVAALFTLALHTTHVETGVDKNCNLLSESDIAWGCPSEELFDEQLLSQVPLKLPPELLDIFWGFDCMAPAGLAPRMYAWLKVPRKAWPGLMRMPDLAGSAGSPQAVEAFVTLVRRYSAFLDPQLDFTTGQASRLQQHFAQSPSDAGAGTDASAAAADAAAEARQGAEGAGPARAAAAGAAGLAAGGAAAAGSSRGGGLRGPIQQRRGSSEEEEEDGEGPGAEVRGMRCGGSRHAATAAGSALPVSEAVAAAAASLTAAAIAAEASSSQGGSAAAAPAAAGAAGASSSSSSRSQGGAPGQSGQGSPAAPAAAAAAGAAATAASGGDGAAAGGDPAATAATAAASSFDELAQEVDVLPREADEGTVVPTATFTPSEHYTHSTSHKAVLALYELLGGCLASNTQADMEPLYALATREAKHAAAASDAARAGRKPPPPPSMAPAAAPPPPQQQQQQGEGSGGSSRPAAAWFPAAATGPGGGESAQSSSGAAAASAAKQQQQLQAAAQDKADKAADAKQQQHQSEQQLQLQLQGLASVQWFDARSRVAVKRVAHWLRVPWPQVRAFEQMWAAQALALDPAAVQPKYASGSRAVQYLKVGAAAVGGGALLAVTGGLAAPAIAAGLGAAVTLAHGGAAAAAAVAGFAGSTAGTAAVTGLFGAWGASVGGGSAGQLYGEVKEFGFWDLSQSIYVDGKGPPVGDKQDGDGDGDGEAGGQPGAEGADAAGTAAGGSSSSSGAACSPAKALKQQQQPAASPGKAAALQQHQQQSGFLLRLFSSKPDAAAAAAAGGSDGSSSKPGVAAGAQAQAATVTAAGGGAASPQQPRPATHTQPPASLQQQQQLGSPPSPQQQHQQQDQPPRPEQQQQQQQQQQQPQAAASQQDVDDPLRQQVQGGGAAAAVAPASGSSSSSAAAPAAAPSTAEAAAAAAAGAGACAAGAAPAAAAAAAAASATTGSSSSSSSTGVLGGLFARKAPPPPVYVPLLPTPVNPRHRAESHLALTIAINGCCIESLEDFVRPWAHLPSRDCDRFALVWESACLKELGRAVVAFIAQQALTQVAQRSLQAFLYTGLVGALALPMTLSTAIKVAFGSSWLVALRRAQAAGKMLALQLAQGCHGGRPVTLIGASMGARLVFHCLLELRRLGAAGCVENAILLGSPLSCRPDRWCAARSVVAGRLINGYSVNDWTLGLLYRVHSSSSIWLQAAGMYKVEVPGVENINLSRLITGHQDYLTAMGDILDVINLHDS